METGRKLTVPEAIVRRLCPNGHLPPVARAASQRYCPRCGQPPETLHAHLDPRMALKKRKRP